MDITTIGFDIAKSVFQVHGVDGAGEVVLRRRLSRGQVLALFERLPPCLVGMEACGSAHHWARAVLALALSYKTRSLLVAQRTAVVNALRAHLTEFGIIARQGPIGSAALVALVRNGDERLPELARESLGDVADMIEATEAKIALIDGKLAEVAKKSDACRRLLAIPGIGPVAAGTLLALSGDMTRFRTGRDYAAWLGLTPRQNSSGERVRIGRMSKAGNRDLRTLLVLGQMSVMRRARSNPPRVSAWVLGLMKRRPPLVVAVAMAAKTARIIWAMLSRGEDYRLQAA